jgi:phosphatidylglycerol:prolipoprotein diacylglycerol transferase
LFPKLIEYHSLVIHTYGFLLALAFVVGLYVSARAASEEGLDKTQVYDLGLYLAISALAGAKLLLFITDFEYYLQNPSQILSLETLRSGGVYYGGFLAAVVVGISYTKLHHLPVWKITDVYAPGIALGQAIGRLGCFSAGCCYGKPTSSSLAVVFKNPYSLQTVGVPLLIPLHPTQLYEAAANLVIFVILWLALKRRRFDGQVFVYYLLLYSATRFFIEFLRGDPDRGFLFDGQLSTSQFISIVLMIFATVLYLMLRRNFKKKAVVSGR